MYVWIGCKLPQPFEDELRTVCLEKNKELGLNAVAFSLPQHISLKISFETDRAEEILEALPKFFAVQPPFGVEIREIAQNGSILWMTVGDNEILEMLHERLDAYLNAHFGVKQHLFDTCFQFHSTLFIDPDEENIRKMLTRLADFVLPRELMVDTVLLGISESGKPGTYHVVRRIELR
jgi:hypothetical protein